MGTNYYAYANICPHCGRSDERIHIGKSSYGWKFTFEGHRDAHSCEGNAYEILGRPVKSFADWKELLAKPGVIIRNEYGEPQTLDGLISLVEAKQKEGLSHAECVRRDHPSMRDDVWEDDEGYVFSGRSFS